MLENKNKTQKLRPFLCIELLSTFSEKELKGLKEILSCRYFNTDVHVIKLLEILRKRILNKRIFSSDLQLDVYQRVFADLPKPKGGLNKNQKSLLNAKLNALTRLAEQFLVCEVLKKDEVHKSELLYPELLERKQLMLFNRHINKNKKQLHDLSAKDVLQYEQLYKIENNILSSIYRNGQLLAKDNVSDANRSLDIYYLLNKLSLHTTAVSLLQSSDKKTYDFSSMEAANRLLDISEYAQHPLIMLYQANIKLSETQDNEVYNNLLNLLDKYVEVVPVHLLRSYYFLAINYCISKVWTDRLKYTKEIFDLFVIMHNRNLLIDSNFISVSAFKHLITVSCQVGEFEWAENIIEYYRPFVRKEVRASVCHFLYGVIAFYRKNYETAHDNFIQVDKVNLIYDINTRVLVLKCLYEKEKAYNEYTMTAFRSAESFFKLNKQLPKKNKKGYVNFIKILMTLYRIRHHEKSRTLEWAAGQLEQQEFNSDKRWLLEKIEELKNRKQRSW